MNKFLFPQLKAVTPLSTSTIVLNVGMKQIQNGVPVKYRSSSMATAAEQHNALTVGQSFKFLVMYESMHKKA